MGKGRGADGAERFYAPDEVRGFIPYLSAQNAGGRDIYLTPIDQDLIITWWSMTRPKRAVARPAPLMRGLKPDHLCQ